MNAKLRAFEDARATRELREDGTAYRLAADYVAEHPELTQRYEGRGIPELVPELDREREAGNEETVAEIDAWLMAKHPPQRISFGINPGNNS